MSEYILKTENLGFKYKESPKPSLTDVNINIRSGVKTAILGANGAGKSTLFYHFNGVLKPTSGKVHYDGQPLKYRRKALNRMRSEVAVVLQNPSDQIFASTVEEDVAFGPKNLGMSEAEISERVDEALYLTGLSMLRKQGTLRLSYGQMKRLVLAGAIAMKPKLLILDEPTAGLDPQMAHEVMELADRLHHKGTTVVLSTHDVDLAYAWADEIHVLRSGGLIYSGESEGFYGDQKAVHDAGLMQPSAYCMNINDSVMFGKDPRPYPKTVSELVSKIARVRPEPGKLYVLEVKDSVSEEDLNGIVSAAGGNVRIGLYGTKARKAIYRGKLPSDYVFNAIDNCMSEIVAGRNAVICCESEYIGILERETDRMREFGTETELIRFRCSGDKSE